MFKKSIGWISVLGLAFGVVGCGKESVQSGGLTSAVDTQPQVQTTLEGLWRVQRQAGVGEIDPFAAYSRELISIDSSTIRFVPATGQHQNLDQLRQGTYERISANRIRVRFSKPGQPVWDEDYTYSISGQNISLCLADASNLACRQGVRGAELDRPTCSGRIPNPERVSLELRSSINGRFPTVQVRPLAAFGSMRGLLPESCSPRIEIPQNEIALAGSAMGEPQFSVLVRAILVENDPRRPSAYRMSFTVLGRSASGISSGPLSTPLWSLDGQLGFGTIYFEGARIDIEARLASF